MVKRCALLFVTALVLVPRAHAQRQASDWEVVKRIPIGTQISVQLGRFWFPVKCHLEDATDEDLTCGQGWPIAM